MKQIQKLNMNTRATTTTWGMFFNFTHHQSGLIPYNSFYSELEIKKLLYVMGVWGILGATGGFYFKEGISPENLFFLIQSTGNKHHENFKTFHRRGPLRPSQPPHGHSGRLGSTKVGGADFNDW